MATDMKKGFTLLEVMIALAIMATVVLTLLGAVNYHLGIIAEERHSTDLTQMARFKLSEMELQALPEKSEGTFAPLRPEVKWKTELVATELPSIRKLIIRVQRSGEKEGITLVRYVLK
jgi:general secretion pathway protein I